MPPIATIVARRPACPHAGQGDAARPAVVVAAAVGRVGFIAGGRLQHGQRVALEADVLPIFEDLGLRGWVGEGACVGAFFHSRANDARVLASAPARARSGGALPSTRPLFLPPSSSRCTLQSALSSMRGLEAAQSVSVHPSAAGSARRSEQPARRHVVKTTPSPLPPSPAPPTPPACTLSIHTLPSKTTHQPVPPTQPHRPPHAPLHADQPWLGARVALHQHHRVPGQQGSIRVQRCRVRPPGRGG